MQNNCLLNNKIIIFIELRTIIATCKPIRMLIFYCLDSEDSSKTFFCVFILPVEFSQRFNGPVNHDMPWVAILPWNSVFAVIRLKLWKFQMQKDCFTQNFHRRLDQKVIQSHFRLFLKPRTSLFTFRNRLRPDPKRLEISI